MAQLPGRVRLFALVVITRDPTSSGERADRRIQREVSVLCGTHTSGTPARYTWGIYCNNGGVGHSSALFDSTIYTTEHV